jgi:hypothetical protein
MAKTARKPETDHADEKAERPMAGGAGVVANWNYSLAAFYARRLQKYWQYPFELAKMRSLEEFALSLIEFETELLDDYADQADEFRRIVSEEGRQTPGSRGQVYEAQLLKAQRDAALIIEQAKAQAERIVTSARSRAERLTGDEIVEAARKMSNG